MMLSHKIRLNPCKHQIQYFTKACGVSRFVYNWGLEEWNKQYSSGIKPNRFSLSKQFNQKYKEAFPWIEDVSRDCHSRPFANLQLAFVNYFKKRANEPVFKKKHVRDSFYISSDRIKFKNKKVKIPRLGWVRIREELRFDGVIQSATVSREADQWYISVSMEVLDYKKNRINNNTVAVDLGVAHLATLSNGVVVVNPKNYKKEEKKIKKLNFELSHKKKGGKNYGKIKNKLAKLHLKIKNRRKDYLHKFTSQLCSENQTIIIEDLDTLGLLQKGFRETRKSITDSSFGEIKRQLEYKKNIWNCELVKADRYFPSSKRCSKCGNIKQDLKIIDRVYHCEVCRNSLDRDLNASYNLLQYPGLQGKQEKRSEGVSQKVESVAFLEHF